MPSVWIPTGLMRPVTSGCWTPGYDEYATNDRWKPDVLAFNNGSIREEAHGVIGIPSDMPTTPASVSFDVIWTAILTSGNFQIDFDYRVVGGNDTESLDQTGQNEALTVADVAPGAVNRHMTATLTATASNFNSSSKKLLEFLLSRDRVTESSGIAGPVLVFGMWFNYG